MLNKLQVMHALYIGVLGEGRGVILMLRGAVVTTPSWTKTEPSCPTHSRSLSSTLLPFSV